MLVAKALVQARPELMVPSHRKDQEVQPWDEASSHDRPWM
jgi:hypothetical protein